MNSKQRVINVGSFFSLDAPSDGAGVELPRFGLYQTYRIERSKVQQICDKLYEYVFTQIDKGCLADAKVRLTRYKENILNDQRSYIVITRDTIYKTRATIFIRFLSYGDYLYIGLDAYVLGKLNWRTLLLRILLSSLLVLLPILLPLLILFWQKLVRRILLEGKVGLAMRQEFPGSLGNGPFDADDILMFLKSTLHTAVNSVRDVFEQEGLPIDSLEAFVQSINTINNVNVNTGGGALSMVGSAIGIGNNAK